jgi:hypothetical protein
VALRPTRRRLALIASAILVVAIPSELVLLNTLARAQARSPLDASLPAELQSERPAVEAILDSSRSPWQKAIGVMKIVKAATPPIYSGVTCDVYADWYVTLVNGRGLRARPVTGTLHLLNEYDTHTTVEVWLPQARRWVIVDPTFGGYFTVDGKPVGAHELQRLVLVGETDRVRWVSSHVKSSAMLSAYYADPVLMFRHVHVWRQNASGRTVMTESERSRRLTRGREFPGDPPWYATRDVRPGRSEGDAFVLVGKRPFTYGGHAAAEIEGRWISPIVGGDGPLPAGVRAYSVPRFPPARER